MRQFVLLALCCVATGAVAQDASREAAPTPILRRAPARVASAADGHDAAPAVLISRRPAARGTHSGNDLAATSAPAAAGPDVDHLLVAADHLEAAGLTEDAQKYRALAEEQFRKNSESLHRALNQIDVLQSEVDRLRALTGTQAQVMISAKVIEISRTKLRRAGLDLNDAQVAISFIANCNDVSEILSEMCVSTATAADKVPALDKDRLAERLREQGALKILAEPTLIVLSGMPARFLSGGEFPVPVPQDQGDFSIEYKSFGTLLEVLPLMLAKDRLRLDATLNVSERDGSCSIQNHGLKVPGLVSRSIRTQAELELGQTLVLTRLVGQRTLAACDNVAESSKIAPTAATEPQPAPPADHADAIEDVFHLVLLSAAPVAPKVTPARTAVEGTLPAGESPDALPPRPAALRDVAAPISISPSR